jgi:hypothetical protein
MVDRERAGSHRSGEPRVQGFQSQWAVEAVEGKAVEDIEVNAVSALLGLSAGESFAYVEMEGTTSPYQVRGASKLENCQNFGF